MSETQPNQATDIAAHLEAALKKLRAREPQTDWLSLPISPTLSLYAKEILGLPLSHRLTKDDMRLAVQAERDEKRAETGVDGEGV